MKPACVVLATAFLVACGGTPKCPVIDEPDPAGSELMIGPEDLLTINVWGQPTLTGPVRVRPDGKITMPLIGDVVVSDRTTKEITTEITQRLTAFIRDVGSVTLAVTETNSYKFNVSGRVMQPGVFSRRQYTPLSEAVSLAGGPNRYASEKVTIVRRDKKGTRRIKIDLKQLLSCPGADITLMRGDHVIVH